MPNRHIVAAAGTIAAVLALATLTSARAQGVDPEWQKIIDAAKKEGTLTYYNGTPSAPTDAVAAAFEKKYGIRVDRVNARANEIRERVRTEQAAGQAIADITSNGMGTATTQKTQGAFQPHGPIPNIKRIIPPFGDAGVMMMFYSGRSAVLINTDLVKPQDEPKTWHDLLDPKWKGKILLDDPRTGSGGYYWFEATLNAFGRGFHEAMAKQVGEIAREPIVAAQRAARGEFPIYMPASLSNYRNLKGLPVKALIMSEGAPYINLVLAILKNAPHPNAAKLYMNFALEDEAQRIFVESANNSVTGATSKDVPAEIQGLLSGKFLGTVTPEKQAEMLQLATEIYK